MGVVREAQQSLRVIDADNIDEMADDILAEEEADDLLEGEWGGVGRWVGCWLRRLFLCLFVCARVRWRVCVVGGWGPGAGGRQWDGEVQHRSQPICSLDEGRALLLSTAAPWGCQQETARARPGRPFAAPPLPHPSAAELSLTRDFTSGSMQL